MRERLIEILGKTSPPEAVAWLQQMVDEQEKHFQQRPFYYAFSGVSRRFDKKATTDAEDAQLTFLSETVPGFTVAGWDEFRLARVILLTVLAEQEKDIFLENLKALIGTADLREQVAIFSAFPLFPHPEALVEFATDGLRSNIIDVFDSISLNNPFAAESFTDEAWNQMVLKAIFITRPLYRIVGHGDRTNPALAEAISDLAHERWAAGRMITPEAWRSCTNFLDERISGDITKMAGSSEANDRSAAALVVSAAEGKLDSLRDRLSKEIAAIESGELTWHSLGQTMEEQLIRKSLT
ncbi:MAG: EboA domain-containing protein [Verrucomicrobiales bacterium]